MPDDLYTRTTRALGDADRLTVVKVLREVAARRRRATRAYYWLALFG